MSSQTRDLCNVLYIKGSKYVGLQKVTKCQFPFVADDANRYFELWGFYVYETLSIDKLMVLWMVHIYAKTIQEDFRLLKLILTNVIGVVIWQPKCFQQSDTLQSSDITRHNLSWC